MIPALLSGLRHQCMLCPAACQNMPTAVPSVPLIGRYLGLDSRRALHNINHEAKTDASSKNRKTRSKHVPKWGRRVPRCPKAKCVTRMWDSVEGCKYALPVLVHVPTGHCNKSIKRSKGLSAQTSGARLPAGSVPPIHGQRCAQPIHTRSSQHLSRTLHLLPPRGEEVCRDHGILERKPALMHN
jgi:hypothetical protein